MIIYGTKATQLATKKIIGECAYCKTQNSVQMVVFQKYAHVFWIPIFPIGKTGATECTHCKQVLTQEEFNGILNNKYQKLIEETRIPYWTFSGLAILGVIITAAIISGRQKNAMNAELILQPQKGDVYEIKIDDRYTLYKVDKVSNDSVFLRMHLYETDRQKGLRDLKNREDEFNQETGIILKNELKVLFDEGTILDIDRK